MHRKELPKKNLTDGSDLIPLPASPASLLPVVPTVTNNMLAGCFVIEIEMQEKSQMTFIGIISGHKHIEPIG